MIWIKKFFQKFMKTPRQKKIKNFVTAMRRCNQIQKEMEILLEEMSDKRLELLTARDACTSAGDILSQELRQK